MADVYADMAEVQETMGRMYGVPAEFNEAELDAEYIFNIKFTVFHQFFDQIYHFLI